MIRLLIVDDSALMRRHLQQLFESEGDFMLDTARNGREAIERVRAFDPHVVLLDINMPEIDGLTSLSIIMAEQPRPVVMFSSLTEQGAMASLEALALGAVDFFAKPSGTISLSIEAVRDTLLAKVCAAAGARLKEAPRRGGEPARTVRSAEPARAPQPELAPGLLLIGSSTGGPRTLEEILAQLPANLPLPVVIAQHMPANFTRALAERLNKTVAIRVLEVDRPMPLEPATVYIGMGGSDVVIGKRAGRLYVMPRPEDSRYLWHPSVSLLVASAMEQLPPQRLIGVMLTGMGYDGAAEMTELKRRGGRTLAESEDTAVVFGMPGELIRRGGSSAIQPSHAIASTLVSWCVRSSTIS